MRWDRIGVRMKTVRCPHGRKKKNDRVIHTQGGTNKHVYCSDDDITKLKLKLDGMKLCDT